MKLQKDINYRNIEKSKSIFSNKLKCGYCQYSLLKSGKSYVCNSYKYDDSMKCKGNSINFKELENTILQIINVFINNFLNKEKNEIYISDRKANINY